MLEIRFEFAFEFLIIFVKGQKKQTKYNLGGCEKEIIYFKDLLSYLPRNLQNNP